MGCRHQGDSSSRSREGYVNDPFTHQRFPSRGYATSEKTYSLTELHLGHWQTNMQAFLHVWGSQTSYGLYKLNLWLTLVFAAFVDFRELFDLLVRSFVEKPSCVLTSCWGGVVPSPEEGNPVALTFAGRCLPGLEVTDFFWKVKIKRTLQSFITAWHHQYWARNTCIWSIDLCSWLLRYFCPYQCPAEKRTKGFCQKIPAGCHISFFLSFAAAKYQAWQIEPWTVGKDWFTCGRVPCLRIEQKP